MRGRRTRRERGFVLIAALVLLALTSLLIVQALEGAATSTALATRLQLRQRAFEAAEAGLAAGAVALRAGRVPQVLELRGEGSSTAEVRGTLDLVDELPAGFTAGRFAIEHITLESVATAPKRTRIALATGWSRLVARP